ncbi:MAG: hypothetical protein ABII06_17830 [Pseudomonadota bacterium]
MAWPLTWVVIVGTLPGVFIGYYFRVLYLPEPKALEEKFNRHFKTLKESQRGRISSGLPRDAVINTLSFSLSKVE